MYISDLITVKVKDITFDIAFGRETKSYVNFYYREWTSGFSGDKSFQGQVERFSMQVEYWKTLRSEDRDIVLLGDANFRSLSCSAP